MRIHRTLPALFIALTISFQSIYGGDHTIAVNELVKSISTQVSETKPSVDISSSRNASNPEDQERHLEQLTQRHEQEAKQIIQLLKRLSNFLKQSNYSEAKGLLRDVERRMSSINPNEQLTKLFFELSTEIEALENAYHVEWYRMIDEKATETREACLSAEKSMELDSLMIEIAKLEMSRPQNSRTILYQRADEELRGIVFTLQLWMRYLDQKNSSNSKAANDQLENLLKNTSNFPILTRDEILSKRVIEEQPENIPNIFKHTLLNVEGRSQLSDAIEKLTAVLANSTQFSPNSGDMKSYVWAIDRLKMIEMGYNALDEGDLDKAKKIIDSFKHQRYSRFVDSIKVPEEALEAFYNRKQIEAVLGKNLPDNESTEETLTAYMLDLRQEQKYDELLKVLELQESGQRMYNRRSPSFAIRDFLAGQRFERVGDLVSAYAEYRKVVGQSADDLVPHSEAMKAMERLRKENPDIVTMFDENSLYQDLKVQINNLNSSLRSLQMRQRSNPHP